MIAPPLSFSRNTRRLGFSLVEVLLATFILGIGLIMVASVFPVGATWTRQTTEDSVAQTVAQDAVAVIRTRYGRGGNLSNLLTPANLSDNASGGSNGGFSFFPLGLQALPGFLNIPVSERSYQFGKSSPFPASNPDRCTYFWAALCRLSPGQMRKPGDPNDAFLSTATYKYYVFILVFRKGAVEQNFVYGGEVLGTRDVNETYIPKLIRDSYNAGTYDGNSVPVIKNAAPPLGYIGLGTQSGTVFTQRASAIGSGGAQARPAIMNSEQVIYAPPAQGTSGSPLIYVYQTTLSL